MVGPARVGQGVIIEALPDQAVGAVDGASTPSVQRKLGKPHRQEPIGDRAVERLCS